MVLRRYRFESALAPAEFLERLGRIVTQQFAIGMIHRGDLYGKVGRDGFDLRTPSSGRGNVIRVIGRVDPAARIASGTLRVVVDPIQSVGFVIVALVVVAIQFFISPGWLRVVVPALVVVLAVAVFLMGRAEWRVIANRLCSEFGVELGRP